MAIKIRCRWIISSKKVNQAHTINIDNIVLNTNKVYAWLRKLGKNLKRKLGKNVLWHLTAANQHQLYASFKNPHCISRRAPLQQTTRTSFLLTLHSWNEPSILFQRPWSWQKIDKNYCDVIIVRTCAYSAFETGGWASGRASSLQKWSDEVLAWSSVCSEVQTVCIWFSWCLCHPTPASLKFRLVLPISHQITQDVLEKRRLNWCSSSCSTTSSSNHTINWHNKKSSHLYKYKKKKSKWMPSFTIHWVI